MKQSKRLQPICDFKQREEDEAARILAIAAQEMSAQKQRLTDLESYHEEYEQQFSQTSRLGVNAKQMKDYHAFMNNLDQVLGHQRMAIENSLRDFDEKKRQWLAARNRTKALTKVQENYQKQEDVQEEKKQQKEQDDRSTRILRY